MTATAAAVAAAAYRAIEATTFAVPAGFPGYLLACQTVALDASNPLGFVVSNVGMICLQ